MTEVNLNVTLIAHTKLSNSFWNMINDRAWDYMTSGVTDGQLIAFTAIRNCYSHLQPTEIINEEIDKYFGQQATDGGKGNDADRLCRYIMNSGHTSTLEHVSFVFAIEYVSRALLAQITRHRVGWSFSVKSQRYVKFGTNNKSGGATYIVPEKVRMNKEACNLFLKHQELIQETYDALRELGIPSEDARSVLNNATSTSMVTTCNISSLLHFYSKRRKGRGAQEEIANLAEQLRREVVQVEPWLDDIFETA